MSKVIIIYSSLTGNTEEMSEAIEQGALETGIDVVRKDAYDATASDLLDFDGIILGAYTWGDGELPDEFLDFYEEMCELDLAGKLAAVFGSGDTSYAHYCGAVEILEHKLQELGAEIVHPSLKFEYNASDDELQLGRSLGHTLAGMIGVKS